MQRHGAGQSKVETLNIEIVEPGSVTLARKLDRYRKTTVRIVLERWLVEAAMSCLPQALGPADQRIIVKATRRLTKSGGPNGGANVRNPKQVLLTPPRIVDLTDTDAATKS